MKNETTLVYDMIRRLSLSFSLSLSDLLQTHFFAETPATSGVLGDKYEIHDRPR